MYAWLYMYISKICAYVRVYVHVRMQMCANNRSSLAIGFKTGILICLKTVHLYRNVSEIRL